MACLVLEVGKVVTVGRLMGAVYGERLPSSARVQVQICVSGLRRLLTSVGRPNAIVTRNQGYVLSSAGVTVDFQRYDGLVGEARVAGDLGRKDEAIERYREALGLWRGVALEGLEGGPLQSAAERFAERRLTVNEDCIEYELDLGRHRYLIPELVGLVAANPLRERLRGQLMLALYRSGRQAEALDAYRAARRTLADELGLEPGEWLQRLERSILTGDCGVGVPVPVVAAIPGPMLDPVRAPEPAPRVEAAAPAAAAPAAVSPDPGLCQSGLSQSGVCQGGVGSVRGVGLAGEPVTAGLVVPHMLPTDIADFTGRVKEIDAVQVHFSRSDDDLGQRAVPVVVLVGKPGIGKTALAVHVSHRLVSGYPDGQLFADLHGRGADRVGPMQVLERFLRALGVPGGGIPDGLDERAEMYRDLLSDRRVLVVLDNAGGESAVLPLLPGNPRTAVIVTSRGRLGGLPGAVHLDVDVLEPGYCVELLGRIAGVGRFEAEEKAAVELAELCGRLPLALRIAGARLFARPHWSVGQLVGRLENESCRLDELNHGGIGIRVSISMVYEQISGDARRLFRRLAVWDGPVFSVWVCAAVLDQSLLVAHDLLDELIDAQLVEVAGDQLGARSRYRLHDLIRVFARERLAAEEPLVERDACLRRVFGAFLLLAEHANGELYGPGRWQGHCDQQRWPLPPRVVRSIVGDPLDWFERERLSIVAVVRQAARVGAVGLCWDLARTSVALFDTRVYLNDWRDTHQIALAAARQGGDVLGQAVLLDSIGALGIVENRFADARRNLQDALELFEAAGVASGLSQASRNIAYLDWVAGDLDSAAVRYQQALSAALSVGDLSGAAYILQSLAQVELERGDATRAKSILPRALEFSRQTGDRRSQAQVLHRLGEAYLAAGEPVQAAMLFQQALTLATDLGDAIGTAFTMLALGEAQLRSGEHGKAAATLTRAQQLADTHGESGPPSTRRVHPGTVGPDHRQATRSDHSPTTSPDLLPDHPPPHTNSRSSTCSPPHTRRHVPNPEQKAT